MKNANEVKDQVVEEVNEVETPVENEAKEEKVVKIFGFEIRKVKKEPKPKAEESNTAEGEEKPEKYAKAKKFAKRAGTALAIVGSIAAGYAIGQALNDDLETETDDNHIYELPPMEAEWKPVEETVGSEAKAETESPKED
jgi:hypothetical protein